ncbi:sulfurtransferase [Xanthomonas campestris pv. phormiicola]|nr:sulfurtransferase [Xanthomonas campestris pv. phormiicola]UYC14639.1 sulfurtransferase [Xanthomonas campestris pv. phormiicola]
MIANTAAYHFVAIADPDALAARLQDWAQAGALRGTILVAGEGINLFLAGAAEAIDDFYAQLRADPRFAALRVKTSRSAQQPFARLKTKVKPEIISFRRDAASPLAAERAPAVAPATLQRWLRQGHDDSGRRVVLLDTRNAQEVEYGSFAGALTLPIVKFTELPEALAPHRAELADATVVSFCTGGIRCEKAALWMRADGMHNVLQLDGGILGYFEQVGGEGYAGRCFVFDERVALDPQLRPLVDVAEVGIGESGLGIGQSGLPRN